MSNDLSDIMLIVLGATCLMIWVFVGPFGIFSLPMAIRLRTWWPGWFYFYCIGSTLICLPSVYSLAIDFFSEAAGMGLACLIVIGVIEGLTCWPLRFDQPHVIYHVQEVRDSKKTVQQICDQIAQRTSNALGLKTRRRSERQGRVRILLTTPVASVFNPKAMAVVIDSGTGQDFAARVHCLDLGLSTGKELEQSLAFVQEASKEIESILNGEGLNLCTYETSALLSKKAADG